MLLHRLDPSGGTALWYFFGTENSDADFERYIASIHELKKHVGTTSLLGTGLMLVDRHNPAPNATWRKRIAEASADVGSNNIYALVCDSLAIRGVATAINWLRPPKYEFRAFGNLEEGFDWIGARRGTVTAERMRSDLLEMRSEAAGKRGDRPRG